MVLQGGVEEHLAGILTNRLVVEGSGLSTQNGGLLRLLGGAEGRAGHSGT